MNAVVVGTSGFCHAFTRALEENGVEVKRISRIEQIDDICIYDTVISCEENDEVTIHTVLSAVLMALENDCTPPKIIALVQDEHIKKVLERFGADMVLPVNVLARVVAWLVVYPYAGTLLLHALKGTLPVHSIECTSDEGCDPYSMIGRKGIPIAVYSRGRWKPPKGTLKPGDVLIYLGFPS